MVVLKSALMVETQLIFKSMGEKAYRHVCNYFNTLIPINYINYEKHVALTCVLPRA